MTPGGAAGSRRSRGPEHDGALEWLTTHFARVDNPAWKVRIQSTLLVVEVAQTSQTRDRDKARDYAAADVPEYWIVDLAARNVTVHRSPGAGIYEEVVTYVDGASVRPVLADAPAVPVSDVLG